jgi:hypothetical protein
MRKMKKILIPLLAFAAGMIFGSTSQGASLASKLKFWEKH